MSIKKTILSITLFLVLLLAILPVRPVLADVAPPAPPPGSDPDPGNPLTQVAMVAETVEIEVKPTNPGNGRAYLAASSVQGFVNARFTMHNQGSSLEKLKARFPLSNVNGEGDGFGNYPEIKDIQVFVGQQVVKTTRMTTPNPRNSSDPPVAWAAFDVSFPPDEDVQIEVKYLLKADGYMPIAQFTYLLETGAGWNGPIGSIDLILLLPYSATPENVLDIDTTTPPGGKMDGNRVTWHLGNLEPTSLDNWRVSILAPSIWTEVLTAKDAINTNPRDGAAWGRLARAYKYAILEMKGWLRTDEAGKKLYDQCIEAYEQAIALAPQEARWHAGYAELLWHSIFIVMDKGDPLLAKIVNEVRAALKLEPGNTQALQVLEELSAQAPEVVEPGDAGYVYHLLTATLPREFTATSQVTSSPVPLPTKTPRPTKTPMIAVESPIAVESTQEEVTPIPASTQEPVPTSIVILKPTPSRRSLPLSCPCSSTVLVPAVVVLGGYLSLLKKKRPGS